MKTNKNDDDAVNILVVGIFACAHKIKTLLFPTRFKKYHFIVSNTTSGLDEYKVRDNVEQLVTVKKYEPLEKGSISGTFRNTQISAVKSDFMN